MRRGRVHPRRDAGFTLAELLVVIVILGILATVTVFAVSGISDRSQETACSTEMDNLEKAQEVHFTLAGTYADEATLVSTGAMKAMSQIYDLTGDATGYTLTPAAGSNCTVTLTGGGGGSTPSSPPAVTMPTSSFGWHGGVTAWRYAAVSGDNEIVVIGGDWGKADWVASDTAGAVSPRRTHFVDIASLDAGSLNSLITSVNNNGDTTLVVYTADDTQPIGGSASVMAYLTGPYNISGLPRVTLTTLNQSGIQSVFSGTAP